MAYRKYYRKYYRRYTRKYYRRYRRPPYPIGLGWAKPTASYSTAFKRGAQLAFGSLAALSAYRLGSKAYGVGTDIGNYLMNGYPGTGAM